MFTGIVQGTAELVHITQREDFRTHVVRLPQDCLGGLKPGASLAHNGCCLTLTHLEGDLATFDLMAETLRLTNLGELRLGDRVNLERAAGFGDEIGGHLMSGHIIATAKVREVIATVHNYRMVFDLPESLMKYVFYKGYIGVDGISLTIGEVQDGRFEVNLIPETLQRTTIGQRRAGERVNIEVDPQTQAIVDTVERLMAARSH